MQMFQISLTKEQYEELGKLLNTNADIIDDNVLNCDDADLEYWENKQFLHAQIVEAYDGASMYSI